MISFLTYGDGVADIDLKSLRHFHKSHGRKATLTATRPPGRYGALRTDDKGFVIAKKNPMEMAVDLVLFCFVPDVIDTIDDYSTSGEEPLSA